MSDGRQNKWVKKTYIVVTMSNGRNNKRLKKNGTLTVTMRNKSHNKRLKKWHTEVKYWINETSLVSMSDKRYNDISETNKAMVIIMRGWRYN